MAVLKSESGEPMPKKKKKNQTYFTPGGGSWVVEVSRKNDKVVKVRQFNREGDERPIPSIVPCSPRYVARKKRPWYARMWRAVVKWMESVFG